MEFEIAGVLSATNGGSSVGVKEGLRDDMLGLLSQHQITTRTDQVFSMKLPLPCATALGLR